MNGASRAGIVGLVLLVGLAAPLRAQDAKAAAAAPSPGQLRRLLAATGEEKLVREMSAEVLASAKATADAAATATGRPPGGLQAIEAAYDPERLMEIVGSVYASHFTPAEIDEMIRFWESAVGRKLSALQPQIVEETRAALARWVSERAGPAK
jgi:hypothetical protein